MTQIYRKRIYEQISRTESYLIDLTDTTNNIDALEDARDVVEASTLDPEPFAFSSVFIFTEQVDAVPRLASLLTLCFFSAAMR